MQQDSKSCSHFRKETLTCILNSHILYSRSLFGALSPVVYGLVFSNLWYGYIDTKECDKYQMLVTVTCIMISDQEYIHVDTKECVK